MPAQRKPLGQRVRRNADPKLNDLPMEGYQGDYPDWPYREGSEIELALWDQLWRSPMAAEWVRAANPRQVARFVRLDIMVEAEMHNSIASAQMLNSLLSLEKQLGIGPDSLRLLNWNIPHDEVEEQREAAPPRRRLKAVDPDGAA